MKRTKMNKLEQWAEHIGFYEATMLVFIFILFSLGVILIIIGIFSESIVKVPSIVGGSVSEALLMYPFNKLKALGNKRDYLRVAGLFLDKFPDKIDQNILKQILETIKHL